MEKSEAMGILKLIQEECKNITTPLLYECITEAGYQPIVINQGESSEENWNDIKDFYEGGSGTGLLIEDYGQMVSFHIFELENDMIHDWYDADEIKNINDLEYIESSAKTFELFLAYFGISILDVPAGEGSKRKTTYSFMGDRVNFAVLSAGGFKMPKPLNYQKGIPIKQMILDVLNE